MAGFTKKLASLGLDAAILLFFTGLVAIDWVENFEYQSGLTNRAIIKEQFLGEFLPLVLAGLLPLGCIAVMILRFILQKKRVPAWGSAARCCIILLMCAGVVYDFSHRDPGIYSFAQGFEVKMKREVDVKAIRAWANNLAVPKEEGVMPSVPKKLWPESVTVLSPRDVFYDEEVRGVRLHWGGGHIMAYGLVVEPENMEMPHTTDMELVIPLEAGAYLFFFR